MRLPHRFREVPGSHHLIAPGTLCEECELLDAEVMVRGPVGDFDLTIKVCRGCAQRIEEE